MDALLGGKAVIGIATVAGRVEDVWVSDDPSGPNPHEPADAAVTFRLWDGTPWKPSAP